MAAGVFRPDGCEMQAPVFLSGSVGLRQSFANNPRFLRQTAIINDFMGGIQGSRPLAFKRTLALG